jgi:hypothetical protein
MTMQDLMNTKSWNDGQLEEATKMLCEVLNTSKVSLKNEIKAGGFYMVHKNCLQSHNYKYTISVYGGHGIYIGMYVKDEDDEDFKDSERFEDSEISYKWEDLMNNPNLVIDEFKFLRNDLGFTD